MRVAVFGDAHAHAEALDAVIAAAEDCAVQELWSLGDMIGMGPDPERVVARIRERCAVALLGNHDYAATGSVDPGASGNLGPRRSARSSSPASAWPARTSSGCARADRRRAATACSAGMAARATRSTNTSGLPTPQPAWRYSAQTSGSSATPTPRPPGNRRRAARRPTRIRPGDSLDLAGGKWLLNPGAIGAPAPPRGGWWDGLDLAAADGAFWLLLDLDRRTATWRRAPYDPAPARRRARALGLDDA